MIFLLSSLRGSRCDVMPSGTPWLPTSARPIDKAKAAKAKHDGALFTFNRLSKMGSPFITKNTYKIFEHIFILIDIQKIGLNKICIYNIYIKKKINKNYNFNCKIINFKKLVINRFKLDIERKS